MLNRSRYGGTNETNPHIALADTLLNLVFILIFVIIVSTVLGRIGWEEIRYRDMQKEFREAVERALPEVRRPLEHFGKNDPPGVQRWVFSQTSLFYPGTAELTLEGERILVAFSKVVMDTERSWRRIRIEGHTVPNNDGEPDDWELAASRAAQVARVFHVEGLVPPYKMAVSSRAGQDPVDRENPNNPANERVEVAIEYTKPNEESEQPELSLAN